jgi:hypothetical protein
VIIEVAVRKRKTHLEIELKNVKNEKRTRRISCKSENAPKIKTENARVNATAIIKTKRNRNKNGLTGFVSIIRQKWKCFIGVKHSINIFV